MPPKSTHSFLHTYNFLLSQFKMSDSHHSSDNTTENTKKKQSPEFQDDEFSEEEESLIIRMYNLLGDRWSLIAGRIPGRTAEEIERYWKSRCSSN
ncbi:Myb domain-containing protein [Dioscorea alata]|uniref:Myb domain-containing protein n=1 Tax=Dioscorea alata TaxID=55571 RepID=A0ACB7TUE4_DIOAL|nr:Myb domain-containing protein [Dioscorea alata]